jgi:F plasmid transfer operon, TraF, protein
MFKSGQAGQIQHFGGLVAAQIRLVTPRPRLGWGVRPYAKLARMRAPARATLMGLAAVGMCWIGCAGECAAQGFESLGVRALGMGGAFVAVADDATAIYWNPAGLATGAIVSAVAERTQGTTGEPGALPHDSGTFVGLALPPVGVSYYRLRSARVLPNDAAVSLVTQQVGVTLVQSIGERLDVAGTIKYVHGDAGVGSNTVDVDLGALAHLGAFRAGLVVRNLRQPSFDAPNLPNALRFDRQVRAGVAWQAPSNTTISCDARPTGSAGVSVAVRPSIWVDAQITRGVGPLPDRGWGLAARMGF